MHRTLLLGLLLGLLAVPVAWAEPPAGAKCVGQYNPSALTNICFGSAPLTQPIAVSGYQPGVSEEEVCVIGNTCAEAPLPTLTPTGAAVTVPGLSRPDPYVEVLRQDLVETAQELYGRFSPCLEYPTIDEQVACIASQIRPLNPPPELPPPVEL